MKKTINILVVDDDPNLRKTLSDIMRVKGYAVVSAANGAAAIAESQQTAVNVALIDLMLPDMSGIEVMERIKTGSPHTEAIILTGHASLTTAIEATTKGAFSYLLKPYEVENLLLHIRHAVDRQQAQEEIRRLASFPRLNPQAVIELAPSGEVTYANPAADKLFPDLRLLDGQHPLLIGLGDIYATFRQGGQTEMVREVSIGESSYEKHLYYVPESELIRITVIDVTERKRAEESLRKLSQAVEQSPSAIVITDLDANIEYVNEGFVKVTGYSRAEVAGQNPRLLHSGKTPGETYKEMWASLKRGEMWKGELINRRKDGSEYIESALISPVRQADGRVTHYLAVKEDITQLKQAQEALRDSRDSMHLLLNSMAEGAYGVDTNGDCTFVNQAFLQMLGYQDENEVLGKHIHELIHHSHADGSPYPDSECNAYRTYRINQTTNISDEVFWRKDGVAIPVEYWSHPIVAGDVAIGAIVTFIDITARKQAEAAVLQLNEELENKVAARTADLEHARIEAEQANRAKSEFLVNMSHEIRTPMNGVIGMIDVLKQSGLNDRQIEMANIIHDSAFALLAVIDDILDFSSIEAGKLQIVSSPMIIADVVDGVCETLDSLAEKNSVELILSIDPAIPSSVLGDSARLRQILLKLVNNAIKFSGGQQRHGRVSVRAILVNPVRPEPVEGTNGHARFPLPPSTSSGQAKPPLEIPPPQPSPGGITSDLAGVVSQPSRMASSSIRGSEREKQLSIPESLRDVKQILLEFRVTDNGIGMDAATQARLFTAFTQADASTTRSFGGAGLGLSISRHLVKLMGGEITVQSEPGTGSTFTVRLSFALPPTQSGADAVHIAAVGDRVYGRKMANDRKDLPDNAGATSAPLPRKEVRQQGSLILIAEDNEINQKVILQQLKLLGQTADVADNGREALERWQGGGYSLLFTDLHMPEMDGYELTAAIRAAEKTGNARMPIIAITANALKGEAERCRKVGMDDYLSKPVQLASLKAMLDKWIPGATESSPVEPVSDVGRDSSRHASSESVDAAGLKPDLQSPTPAPVDVNVLKALVGDDEAVIREFLRDFRISAAKIAAELKAACNGLQAAQAGALAHKLKSSARSMGALTLGELCAEMEQAGKSGQIEALTVLLPRFEAEMAAVDEYLGLFLK